MSDSPIKRLRARARELGARAVDGLLATEERAKAVGSALQKLQQAKNRLDEQQLRMLGAIGVATRSDLERVARRVGRLRKRMLTLLERLPS